MHVVSMEAVAERAGVSRPLVYKHFANRDELLAAAYRREASKLHQDLIGWPLRATSRRCTEPSLRGSIRATVERGQIFTALRAAGWNRDRGGATIERPRHGPGLRRRGSPAVWLGSETFRLGHGRAVGRARRGPRAMAYPSDRGKQGDPRRDVPRHGCWRLFGGVGDPLGVCGHRRLKRPAVLFGATSTRGAGPWRSSKKSVSAVLWSDGSGSRWRAERSCRASSGCQKPLLGPDRRSSWVTEGWCTTPLRCSDSPGVSCGTGAA